MSQFDAISGLWSIAHDGGGTRYFETFELAGNYTGALSQNSKPTIHSRVFLLLYQSLTVPIADSIIVLERERGIEGLLLDCRHPIQREREREYREIVLFCYSL